MSDKALTKPISVGPSYRERTVATGTGHSAQSLLLSVQRVCSNTEQTCAAVQPYTIQRRLTRYIWWSSAPVFSPNDDYDNFKMALCGRHGNKLARNIWTKSWRIPCETRLQKGERRDISIYICGDFMRDKSQKKLFVFLCHCIDALDTRKNGDRQVAPSCRDLSAASKYVPLPHPPTVSFFRGNTKRTLET